MKKINGLKNIVIIFWVLMIGTALIVGVIAYDNYNITVDKREFCKELEGNHLYPMVRIYKTLDANITRWVDCDVINNE